MSDTHCPECGQTWCCHVGDWHDTPICPRPDVLDDKCPPCLIAALRLALATATRERDEARNRLNVRGLSCTPDLDLMRLTAERDIARAERDAAVARLNATEALLLDVWDSHHREGWEATETERSVIDRLGDWRWNNGFDPHNPPMRPDPRKKGAHDV